MKNKDKVSDTIKTVDSSIKSIKKIFGAKKKEKEVYLRMLLGTLATNMLGSALTRSGAIRVG